VKPKNEPSLGDLLRTLREERGMSLFELEKASGVGRGYIWELEKEAKDNPSIDILQKIARGLDVPVSKLIGEPRAESGASAQEPPGFKEFLEKEASAGTPVPPEDIEWLRPIMYRGRRPRTADDWSLLYELVKRLVYAEKKPK